MREPMRCLGPRAPLLLTGSFVTLFACVAPLASVRAEPGRDIRFAESSDRRVLAFIFGHKDTCRVIRRRSAPPFSRDDMRNRGRYGASYRGEPGDKVITEFDFGRGRPVHIVPSNGGRFLLAFSNRSPDGAPPTQDRLFNLADDDVSPRLDYRALPRAKQLSWPALKRALPRKKKTGPAPAPGSYAFVSRQDGAGPVLVARRTEWEDGHGEIVCFSVSMPSGKVALPSPAVARRLLDDKEPLMRAGSAWVLGHAGKATAVVALRGALSQARDAGERAAVAWALVRCGEEAGRRTLHALLADPDDSGGVRAAAFALTQLGPQPTDGDALAEALVGAKGEAFELVGKALCRLGPAGSRALLKASRATDPNSRGAVATVLGKLDDLAAERRLLALVRDRNESVATAAVRALINPPRRILAEHHGDFARCLDHVRRLKFAKPSVWLCVLAAQSEIKHDKVLKALVGLAPQQDRAIWALRKLTGNNALETPKDCRTWWRDR